MHNVEQLLLETSLRDNERQAVHLLWKRNKRRHVQAHTAAPVPNVVSEPTICSRCSQEQRMPSCTTYQPKLSKLLLQEWISAKHDHSDADIISAGHESLYTFFGDEAQQLSDFKLPKAPGCSIIASVCHCSPMQIMVNIWPWTHMAIATQKVQCKAQVKYGVKPYTTKLVEFHCFIVQVYIPFAVIIAYITSCRYYTLILCFHWMLMEIIIYCI